MDVVLRQSGTDMKDRQCKGCEEKASGTFKRAKFSYVPYSLSLGRHIFFRSHLNDRLRILIFNFGDQLREY
jgi:hypothetical protein